jgi:tRNA dimethylallyltransferase
MVASRQLKPLLVIVGETGSGKTALAIELAKKFDGEVIAADSRTVYKGMDIGTAKPSTEDQLTVPHHLLDISTPDKPITVALFQELANKAIDEIHNRGNLPIVVGGTGLYIDALLFNYSFLAPKDDKVRKHLNTLSVIELQAILSKKNIPFPQNSNNPRHLIRTIETEGLRPNKDELRSQTLIIGLALERDELIQRLKSRIDIIFKAGLVEETVRLVDEYGWDNQLFRTPAYSAAKKVLLDQATIAQAKENFLRGDLHLAKQQRTWFKRNKSIHWVKEQIQAVDLTTTFLSK